MPSPIGLRIAAARDRRNASHRFVCTVGRGKICCTAIVDNDAYRIRWKFIAICSVCRRKLAQIVLARVTKRWKPVDDYSGLFQRMP
jgi:hypothetical protein